MKIGACADYGIDLCRNCRYNLTSHMLKSRWLLLYCEDRVQFEDDIDTLVYVMNFFEGQGQDIYVNTFIKVLYPHLLKRYETIKLLK